MADLWVIVLAISSAFFISGLALWRRLSRRQAKMQTEPLPQVGSGPAILARQSEPTRPGPDPEVLRLVLILFGPESAALSPSARGALSEAATRLTDRPELTVTVEGSADSSGNATRNLVLARDRAWAARQFLLDRGIASERIRSVVRPPSAGRTEYEKQRLRCVRLTWEAT